MITALPGWKVDPNDSNRVIEDAKGPHIPAAAVPPPPVNPAPAAEPLASPTVMTNAGIIEEKIPQMTSQLNAANQRIQPAPTPSPEAGITTGEEDDYDAEVKALLDAMKTNIDTSTNAQIDAIRQNMEVRRAQLADVNRRQQDTTERSLLLGGATRYAPATASGIAGATERAGIMELAELDAQERSLIASANAARDAQNFQLLAKQLEKAEKKREEKLARAAAIAEIQAKENEALRMKERELVLGDVVGAFIDGGISEVSDIYAAVRGLGGDYSPEEIDKVAKIFTVKGQSVKDLPADLETFNYLRDNGMLPEKIASLEPSEQYVGWLNLQKLANMGKAGTAAAAGYYGADAGSGLLPGAGASSGLEEQIVRDRMFVALTPLFNKGVLSNEDRAIIEEKIAFYRNAGMSEGEVLAVLAGFPMDIKTPYNTRFAETIISTTPNADAQRELIGKVSVLMKGGNNAGALRIIENQALARAKDQGVINKDSFVSEDDVAYIKDKVESIDDLLGDDWINSVGAFTGTFNQWLSKRFGFLKATKIKAQLASLTAEMVNKRAGSAITDTEWERLIAPSVPDMKDAAATWKTKLDELQNNALQRHNAAREVAALPPISINQLSPKDRLSLYTSAPVYADPGDGFWGTSSGSGANYLITDGDGMYDIPED